MKPFKLILRIVMVLFITNLPAQSLVKCNNNMAYWIIPDNDLLYAIALKGDVDLSENPDIININETALQYILLDKSNYLDKKNDDEPLLLRYIATEQEHLRNIFATRSLLITSEIILLPALGKKAVFWSFDLPEGKNSEVVSQLFLNIVSEGNILGLGTPLFTDSDFSEAKKLLIDALETLHTIPNTESLCQE